MELIIPHEFVNGPGHRVDANEVNDNFTAIASVVNGNLGTDNVGGGLPPRDQSVTFKKLAPGLVNVYTPVEGDWILSSTTDTYAKSTIAVVPAFTPDIDCQIIVQGVVVSYIDYTDNNVQYRIGVCEDIQNQLPTSPPLYVRTVHQAGESGQDASVSSAFIFAMNLTAGKQYRFVFTGNFKSSAPDSSVRRHLKVIQPSVIYQLLPR